jgi:hypothetical protein
VIPGADHLSAVANPASFDAVLEFLAEVDRAPGARPAPHIG